MGDTRVTVDCAAFRQPDLGTVDALLRLRLVLKRAGEDLVLENSSPQLRELMGLAGVQEVLERAPSVQAGREAEERE
jgi:hypothetical protein